MLTAFQSVMWMVWCAIWGCIQGSARDTGGKEISYPPSWLKKKNINKARQIFFHFGVFHGDISPILSRYMLEACVMLILFYGWENWILTERLLKKLVSFLGELAKWICQCPKHISNTAAVTCLDLPSMQFRILVSKLGFLVRLLKKDGENLGGSVVLSLCNGFNESWLIRECRELEDAFGTNSVHWSDPEGI